MTALADKTTRAPLHRNRDFGLLWVGAGFSFLGSRVTSLVYPMLVLWSGGSKTLAGLAGFTALVPQLLVQLPAGAFVDRRDRRRLMLACEAGVIAALGTLAVAVALGHLWLPHLFAVAFVEGSLLVVYQLAERSAVPHLVEPDQLSSAYSRNEARTRGASMLGQPAGTGLFAAGNALPLAFGVGAHAASFLALLGIKSPMREERASTGDLRAEILSGFSWLWRQRFLRALLLVLAGTNMLFQMLTFALLPLFRDEGWPKGLVGVVLAFSGVGGLVGALTANRWTKVWSLRRILLVGVAVWAVVTSAAAFAHSVVLLSLLFAVSGYVGGVFNVPAIVYVMRIAPPDMRGRVSAVANLVSSGAMALGWVAAGLLLTAVTPRHGIATIGAATAVIAVSAALSPAIRGADGAAETRPLG